MKNWKQEIQKICHKISNYNDKKNFLKKSFEIKKKILFAKKDLGSEFKTAIQYVKSIENNVRKMTFEVKNNVPFVFANNSIGTYKGSIIDFFKKNIFLFLFQNGFKFVECPDLDHVNFVFDKLNISSNHSSRSKKDTFYISSELVLRTHTTSINTHFLSNTMYKLFCIGNVYRRDDDSTHLPSFHQVEIVYMHKDANIQELFNLMTEMISFLINRWCCSKRDLQIRFRPHYFPYTSPSFEMDIYSNNSWIEVLGCGMLRKSILENAGVCIQNSALAAGMGIERVILCCMSILGINISIKDLYEKRIYS